MIITTTLQTPIGPMLAGAVADGICLVEFTDRIHLDSQIRRLCQLLAKSCIPGRHSHLTQLQLELDQYFAGTRTAFSLPLVVPGTAFQQRAWAELGTILYGETRSYAAQAERMGNGQAARAVARANGDNRIAILVPCHRLVGKNGGLTGYGGGLWRKHFLLEHEHHYR